MATANEGSSYEGGGGGAGGKFRKKPFRKSQTTPYDRPPTALRNLSSSTGNNNNGWLSKLVDPASKLITASAHRLFASVFRKRLPPPSQSPQHVSEAKKESKDKLYQAFPTANKPMEDPPGLQQQNISEGDNPSNNSDSSGFIELEQVLKQKTFTRSEIDRLTVLLQSRSSGMPAPNGENRLEASSLRMVGANDIELEPAKSPMQENGIQSHKSLRVAPTPIFSSRVIEEDVASPSELAKAYMGNRPSKVSPSMLCLRSQAFREESPLLSNVPFTPKSPILSLVPKSSVNAGVLENGYMTPRSRGRSAIYSMARTPYSRIHQPSSHKGSVTKFDAYGEPSASSSQYGLEGSRLSGSKQGAIKRRSSVLDNDIGSIGPIRRIRQKPNLLSSKSLSLSVPKSPLSGTGVVSKLQTQNGSNILPATSFSSVPSQSSEMAQKILMQLDKLVPPKDKSSELKLAIAREESPAMLTSVMLNGKARRSLENVDLSRFLENVRDNKFDDSPRIHLPEARGSAFQEQDKVEGNGPMKVMNQFDRSAHAVNGVEATVPNKDSAPITKFADSPFTNPTPHPPQKKRAFQMSAHEDYLDLDDDDYANGTASHPLAQEREKLDTTKVESKNTFSEAVIMEKSPVSSEVKPLASSILKTNSDLETFKSSNGSVLAEKSSGFAFPVARASSMTVQPITPSPGSNSAVDKVLPKELHNAPPIFNFGSNNVDKVPPLRNSEFAGIKPGASSDLKLESSSSFVSVAAGGADVTLVPELSQVDKNTQKAADIFREPEAVLPSAASTSTPTSSISIYSFGSPANNSGLNNGSFASSSSTFSSQTPALNFKNVSSQSLSNSATVLATISTATATSLISSGNISTATAMPSLPAATMFKFGPSSSSLSVLPESSGIESTDTQVKNKQETTFGNHSSNPFGGISSAIGSTGSSIFGFSASATTSTSNNPSLGSNLFGIGSGSLASTPDSVGTGAANFTQSTPVQFVSSSSSPTFGLSGTTFASASSLFGSSTTDSKPFSSGASFGLGSSASLSETNSISSSRGTTSIFGSGLQPSKSSIFGATSNSMAPSTGFSFSASAPSTGFAFGAASASIAAPNNTPILFGSTPGTSTGSMFSFTSAVANTPSSTSLSQPQPLFGNPSPAFAFGSSSGTNDHMNMEDTMAEDTMHASTPSVPKFVQAPISSSSNGFLFGSSAPSGVNTFQFGGQQNPTTLQNSSLAPSGANPFQFGNQPTSVTPPNQSPLPASGSLDFNAGGSFSLGSGGGDKSSRRTVKVKRSNRKK